jgi:replicative DNA helicase
MGLTTIAAERGVIGCVLCHPHTLEHIADLLPEHFTDYRARRLLGVLRSINGEWDVTIAAQAVADDEDWISFLASLSGDACSPYTLQRHADTLRRAFAARHMSAAITMAHEAILDLDVEGAAAALEKAAAAGRGWAPVASDVESAAEVASKVFARAEAPSPAKGLSTGLRLFDNNLGGQVFSPSRMVVLAARPCVGKTALSLQIACVAAAETNVVYWCGEMPSEELLSRSISSRSGVPLIHVLRGALSGPDLIRVRDAASDVSDLRLHIATSATTTVPRLDALVGEVERRHGRVGLVVVDYLQRVKAIGRRSREEEVGEIARGLKELAKQRNVCVLALAQLNRQIEGRADRRPRMSDLRESGQIEQEADFIAFLDRPVLWEPSADERLAVVDVAKNRHGLSGMRADLTWDGPVQRFGNA